jgi:ferredoxin-type protein NapF
MPATARPSRRDLFRGRLRPPSALIGETCLAQRGVACQSCRDVCPESAIAFPPRLGGVALPLLRDGCTGCGECVPLCPVAAITLAGATDDGA